MVFIFVTYHYSAGFNTPASWFKRTEGYIGLLECLSEENTVISINQIDHTGNCTHNGVQHRFVNYGTKPNYFPIELNKYIKNENPDIVFVQGLHQPLQLIQLGLILTKKTKVIVQHHAEKPFKGIKKRLQRLADNYVDVYLFTSRELGMNWVKNGNISSARKIHEVMEVSSLFHPVDRAYARSKTCVSGDPAFLWVGRLNANKDPLNVVSAFLEFNSTHPTAVLYMIYHTDELLNEIKSLINKNERKDVIIFIGKIPHDELLYWFNSTDFMISGSHYEGSGTAVCEAMSCGCVPIVTDIFSFRMITDNGSCGLLYEAGNKTALLSALKQSLTLDIKKKRNRSLEYFRQKLSFDAIAKQIHEIALSL